MAECAKDFIRASDFNYKRVLRYGTFSQVFLVQNKNSGTKHAMKAYPLESAGKETSVSVELVLEEIRNLNDLNHPNIIKVPYSLSYRNKVCIFMPLMPYGSCSQIIQEKFKTGMPESAVALILGDVLQALMYLHGKKYIHCALKASHILINEDGRAILTGFKYMIRIPEGQAKVFGPEKLPIMESLLHWLSPEILAQDKFGFDCLSDIYSIGLTAIELASGSEPYEEESKPAMLVKKLTDAAPPLWPKDCQPPIDRDDVAGPSFLKEASPKKSSWTIKNFFSNKKVSDPFTEFIDMCTYKDPSLRPPASILAQHKFIKKSQDQTDLIKILQLKLSSDDATPFLSEDAIFSLSSPHPEGRYDESSMDWDFS